MHWYVISLLYRYYWLIFIYIGCIMYSKELTQEIVKDIQALESKSVSEWVKFKVIATNQAVDRDGEIVRVDARDFSNYMKNPVILADHDYKVEKIIGKATNIYQEGEDTIVEGVFSKTNPLWVLAGQLYEEGMLKTVSVWFIGKERDPMNASVFTNTELLELSFVAVPSNPQALSLDGKMLEKAIEAWFIKMDEDEEEEEQELEEKTELQEIKEDVAEIKSILLAQAEEKKKIEEMWEKKKELQELNKALNTVLQKFKKVNS